MNERGKNTSYIHIKNGMHVVLSMMNIVVDRPILRIIVIARPLIELTNILNNNDLIENESLGDQ